MKNYQSGKTVPFNSYLDTSKTEKAVPTVWRWRDIQITLENAPHSERGSIALTRSENNKNNTVTPEISACFQIVAEDTKTSIHQHSFWHLYQVWDGEGIVYLEDGKEPLRLETGDILHVPPWSNHSFEAAKTSSLTLFVLQNLPEMSSKGTLMRSSKDGTIEAIYSEKNCAY